MGDGDANGQDEEEIDELQSEEDVSAPTHLRWTASLVDVTQVVPQASPSKLARMKSAAERTQKKQKRKADESVLQAKREEMDKNKVFLHAFPFPYGVPTPWKISDAVKRYSYLLGQTELFKHFVDIKVRSANETLFVVTFIRISRKPVTHSMRPFLMHSQRPKRGVEKRLCKSR